jgi:2',3'-cyclic-nucleotide 2'-phosphodiesterase (5'-nucleotidase family)
MSACLHTFIGILYNSLQQHWSDLQGVAQLAHLIRQCNFPWLMSNVLDRQTGEPFEACKRYVRKSIQIGGGWYFARKHHQRGQALCLSVFAQVMTIHIVQINIASSLPSTCCRHHVLDWQGVQVGVMGLVEHE